MKKLIFFFIALMITIGSSNTNACVKKNWYENKNPRIEIVNESTIVFKDVIKIEIRTNKKDQITYVYDRDRSKLVKVARGSFEVDLPRGNYLVQSDKKITRTIYEVIVE